MKKKIIYTNEKIGKVEVVKDFLQKPEEFVFKEDKKGKKMKKIKSFEEHLDKQYEKKGSSKREKFENASLVFKTKIEQNDSKSNK